MSGREGREEGGRGRGLLGEWEGNTKLIYLQENKICDLLCFTVAAHCALHCDKTRHLCTRLSFHTTPPSFPEPPLRMNCRNAKIQPSTAVTCCSQNHHQASAHSADISYVAFDYHAECRGGNMRNLVHLRDKLANALDGFEFLHSVDGKVLKYVQRRRRRRFNFSNVAT